jgi:hypothetical protein
MATKTKTTGKKKPSPAQLKARAKFAAMAKARAKAAKGKKATTPKMPIFNPYMPDVDYSKRIKKAVKKVGELYYYGDGKTITPTRLKIGENYEWIAGAGYLEVTYIGRTINFPNVKRVTKFGIGGYLFQFSDGTYTDLSSRAVMENLRTIPGKSVTGTKTRKKPTTSSKHTDTKSHNVKISVMSGYDKMRESLNYGSVYDTSLQLYLVKFANLSFSLWAVTGEGLKKALKHPEGKNQAPIVYRVKSWGIPKFEKMKISELKEFK